MKQGKILVPLTTGFFVPYSREAEEIEKIFEYLINPNNVELIGFRFARKKSFLTDNCVPRIAGLGIGAPPQPELIFRWIMIHLEGLPKTGRGWPCLLQGIWLPWPCSLHSG